ncbi:MAG: ATP-binding protein [Gemmatimonadota bacterium]|jgi:signal transduction histidine kinase
MTSPSHSSWSWPQVTAAAGWLAPWLGVAALGIWGAAPGGAALVVASAGLLAAVVWGRSRTRSWAFGSILLLVGILAGFLAQRQVDRVAGDWSGYWAQREDAVGQRLNDALESRLASAEQAADGLGAVASKEGEEDVRDAVARIRRRFDVTALALYRPDGSLEAWDGSHRGKVPEEVKRGLRSYAYGDLPLFGYLYVTAPVADVGTAVAAILLRTDLPGPMGAHAGDFATAFRREVGEGIRIVHPGTAQAEGGWDLTVGDRTLFTVVLDPPRPAERVSEILNRWRLVVSGLALGAWLLLAVGGPPRVAAGAAAGLSLFFLAGVLPFQEIGRLAPFFAPGRFVLPGPLPLSLGRLAALALAAVTVVAVFPRPRRRLSPTAAGVVGALLFPLFLAWMAHGPAPEALANGASFWVVYQGTVTILLTLLTGTLLVFAPATAERPVLGGLAVGIGTVLAVATAALVWMRGGAPVWWPALWGLAVGLAAASMGAWPGWQRSLASWLLAAAVAGSAALPMAWSHRVQARMAVAGAYLDRLAAPDDPALERALYRLGRGADSLSRADERGVDLLYGAWRESGLAALGEPAWLTLWSTAGIPEEELRVGVAERPVVASQVQEDPGPARSLRIIRYNQDDARYVLRTTLATGEILTAAAPPFADPASRAPLSPLLAGGATREPHPLTLVPVAAESGPNGVESGVRWVRTPLGWQGERLLRFANQAMYRAHYDVALPGGLVIVARATLLLLLNAIFFFLFRAAGRSFLGDALPKDLRWSGLVISFRARVTLALFGFFVLAIAIFGTLAYRSIAGASHRAAEVLAERVAEDASGLYFQMGGRMQALSRRVGVELLEYHGGELREGSVEELVKLGLYEGWVPMSVFTALGGLEDVRRSTEAKLGGWQYVTSYRRLPDGDILAAQVPLQAGATAIRSADVAEILGFAVVLGGVLSLGLALLVGRALTRPLQALHVASERVGAGNLGLRLPSDRADEFGSVFHAFNRMVGRLRRARRQLVRTTRRTQAIMEEAAVGMVALDSSGRVTLVNPRAEGLLGTEVRVGDPFPARGTLGEELAQWLSGFMASDDDESDAELHSGARRFRVRVRRLGSSSSPRGAVVALEDVTDELRTERVLAWGEMARQVAHEVKNPLTPIKLSVQHIRRAWEDRRPDFDSILVRNADAMLVEIDRLAAIAQSFSRFGAPAGAGEVPLAAVDLGAVVDEVLALYGASDGPVRFEHRVDRDLPAAQARVAEAKEVLVNLLENARAACQDGGTVNVEVFADQAGSMLVLRVLDDGAGIPETLMPRVFEPHFSTRSTGTGLGLAIVRRLVESWGGAVSLESTVGRGTTVTVRLRAWRSPAPPMAE